MTLTTTRKPPASTSPKSVLALRMARDLMNAHGMRHWNLELMNQGRTKGRCIYSTQTILLSAKFIRHESLEEVKLTVLHEIAHALTPGHGHDRVWQAKCIAIGGNGQRRGGGYNMEKYSANYILVCTHCDPSRVLAYRYRRGGTVRIHTVCGLAVSFKNNPDKR